MNSSKISNVKLSEDQIKKIDALRNNSFVNKPKKTGGQMEIKLDSDESDGDDDGIQPETTFLWHELSKTINTCFPSSSTSN